ncbi:MAG TPA: ferrochelatase [Acidobacteriota bacterium]|jgi:ferrochelatase|nr:ferrochelatase [Acidobacteriota bacterium]
MTNQTAILMLAYGGPLSLEDVEPYLLDVRRGRPIPPELLNEVRERYRLIGGKSPLLEITLRQATALERRLHRAGLACRVFVGMRHWHPHIGEAVEEMAAAGIQKVVAICMAPQYSRISIGAYQEKIETARNEVAPDMQVSFVTSWHLEPHFIAACAENLRLGIDQIGGDQRLAVLFTAHSLPERIVAEGDPYPRQLQETVEAVCSQVKPKSTAFAYQSQGRTAEKWLGPDAADEIRRLGDMGFEKLLIHPIGFVADHLEILYDDDILYRDQAEKLGFRFGRVPSCNDSPPFIESLFHTVKNYLC